MNEIENEIIFELRKYEFNTFNKEEWIESLRPIEQILGESVEEYLDRHSGDFLLNPDLQIEKFNDQKEFLFLMTYRDQKL